MDHCELNMAIKAQHIQSPTPEEVMSRLAGMKIFTVIDLKDAFWQVPLTGESANLTKMKHLVTFLTGTS